MALIAIWLVSIENRDILFRRYFPNNGAKSSDGKLIAMLTLKEEDQFVAGLMQSLGIDSYKTTDGDSEPVLNFDCTQVNQLPVLGFNLKGHRIWPIIVLEHKGILFCGLPLIANNSSNNNLIDNLSVSVAVSTLQALINHYAKDNRLFTLEEYFSKNMPFGSLITNPYEIEDESVKTKSGLNSSSKQDLQITIRVTEFISCSQVNSELIYGTVYVSNNIALQGNPSMTLKVDNLADLNPIFSPHCWLNNNNGLSVSIKLNSKALRFFHYKVNPTSIESPFLTYLYRIIRKNDSLFTLDLTIEVKGGSSIKFHSFKVNFNSIPSEFISRLSNCNPSQGQLHMDRLSGFYWIVGTKLPKSGKVHLTADLTCPVVSVDLLDASANFRVDNYSHGFPRIQNNAITITDNLNSINYKLTQQLTLATVDYRLKPSFS